VLGAALCGEDLQRAVAGFEGGGHPLGVARARPPDSCRSRRSGSYADWLDERDARVLAPPDPPCGVTSARMMTLTSMICLHTTFSESDERTPRETTSTDRPHLAT
jgi:hypothetical protein